MTIKKENSKQIKQTKLTEFVWDETSFTYVGYEVTRPEEKSEVENEGMTEPNDSDPIQPQKKSNKP